MDRDMLAGRLHSGRDRLSPAESAPRAGLRRLVVSTAAVIALAGCGAGGGGSVTSAEPSAPARL